MSPPLFARLGRHRRRTAYAHLRSGSGKTLAAFLSALNALVEEHQIAPLPDEVRVVYVSRGGDGLRGTSRGARAHVAAPCRLTGLDGVREIVSSLDGYELAAGAWERHVLPARLDRYDPAAPSLTTA